MEWFKDKKRKDLFKEKKSNEFTPEKAIKTTFGLAVLGAGIAAFGEALD